MDGMRERHRGNDKDNGIQNLRKIGNGREIEKERESQRECIRQRKKWARYRTLGNFLSLWQ